MCVKGWICLSALISSHLLRLAPVFMDRWDFVTLTVERHKTTETRVEQACSDAPSTQQPNPDAQTPPPPPIPRSPIFSFTSSSPSVYSPTPPLLTVSTWDEPQSSKDEHIANNLWCLSKEVRSGLHTLGTFFLPLSLFCTAAKRTFWYVISGWRNGRQTDTCAQCTFVFLLLTYDRL